MTRFSATLQAWNTPGFNEAVKDEMNQLDAERLPLQQALLQGSHVSDAGFDVMIISVSETAGEIYVKAGIFYKSIIAGCSCADDPTPMDEQSEYCEVQVSINKVTAETEITLLE